MALAVGLSLALNGSAALCRSDDHAFAAWSQIARGQPRSPANAIVGDHVLDWVGPDGQSVHLVVREPHPGPAAATVIVKPVVSGSDARPAFDAAVAEAARVGAGRLIIPPGRYVFSSAGAQGLGHWVIAGLHDITIDGHGATLIFTQNLTGIYLSGSQRLKFSGLDMEFALPLASLARATSQGGGGSTSLAIDPRYAMTATTQIGHVSEYDPATHEWIKSGQRLYFPNHSANAPVYTGNQTFTSPAFQALRPGATVIVFHHFYGGTAFQVKDIDGQGESEDIVLDGIGIHGGPGMGVVVTKMNRGFALLNSRITPGPDRSSLVSTEYDAVHTLANQGDILIADNTITGQGDDAINLDSPIQYISSVGADNQTIRIANYSRFYRKNDHIAFFDRDGSLIAQAILTAPPRPIGGGSVEVTLNAAVPGLVPRMALRDIDQLPRRFAVVGNTIGHCQCHGIVAQIPDGLIRDNHFRDTTANAIRLITNISQWKEGVGAFADLVERNTISDSGPDKSLAFPFGAISVYGVADGATVSDSPMNGDIRITGNTVSDTAQACIAIASARNVTVQGNHCLDNNRQSSGSPAIVVFGDAQAVVTGNFTQ